MPAHINEHGGAVAKSRERRVGSGPHLSLAEGLGTRGGLLTRNAVHDGRGGLCDPRIRVARQLLRIKLRRCRQCQLALGLTTLEIGLSRCDAISKISGKCVHARTLCGHKRTGNL